MAHRDDDVKRPSFVKPYAGTGRDLHSEVAETPRGVPAQQRRLHLYWDRRRRAILFQFRLR